MLIFFKQNKLLKIHKRKLFNGNNSPWCLYNYTTLKTNHLFLNISSLKELINLLKDCFFFNLVLIGKVLVYDEMVKLEKSQVIFESVNFSEFCVMRANIFMQQSDAFSIYPTGCSLRSF